MCITTITNNNNNDAHWVGLPADPLGSTGRLPIDSLESIGDPTQAVMTNGWEHAGIVTVATVSHMYKKPTQLFNNPAIMYNNYN